MIPLKLGPLICIGSMVASRQMKRGMWLAIWTSSRGTYRFRPQVFPFSSFGWQWKTLVKVSFEDLTQWGGDQRLVWYTANSHGWHELLSLHIVLCQCLHLSYQPSGASVVPHPWDDENYKIGYRSIHQPSFLVSRWHWNCFYCWYRVAHGRVFRVLAWWFHRSCCYGNILRGFIQFHVTTRRCHLHFIYPRELTPTPKPATHGRWPNAVET